MIAVSTDSHESHLEWFNTPRTKGGVANLTFPLVSDLSGDIARDYGVLSTDENDELFGAAHSSMFIID